jgi:hypothetical protein
MPYKNAERQRAAKAESARRCRRPRGTNPVDPGEPAPPLVSGPLRLETAHDLLALLEAQLVAVIADSKLRMAERAQVVGYLATVGLRALEARDLAARVEALERALEAKDAQ